MSLLSKIKPSLIFLIVIFSFALFNRFYNLGYSDYQGDEIKAFFNPKADGDFFKFLIDQRKGPNQFLVTGLIKGISNNYQNYFVTRLPFAVAGFLSVIVFYLITLKFFNKRTATWATIFFATNGILVAFSRIAQYQSFVILFGLLGILFYQKYNENKKNYFISFSLVSISISILFHYDGVFFGIPIFVWIIKDLFFNKTGDTKKYLVNLGIALLLFLALLASFYIPFILNLTDKTKEYWLGRISGDVSTKISSSYYLFSVYQPIYAARIYILLSVLGILMGLFNRFKKRTEKSEFLTLMIWILIPFAFMEGLVSIPGTHIYTYLIPVMILMGFGIDKLMEMTTKKYLIGIGDSLMLLLFLFLALQTNTIFVDHKGEYPWQEKKFLIFTLNKPTPIFHLSMFGFPYNREWQEISKILESDQTSYFSTNERVALTRFYLNNPKDNNKAKFFVYIENPQTFTNEITNPRTKSWASKNSPIKEFTTVSGNKVKIYQIDSPINQSGESTNDNSEN